MKGHSLRGYTAANQNTIRAWVAMGHELQTWASYCGKKRWVDIKPVPYIRPWCIYRIKPKNWKEK